MLKSATLLLLLLGDLNFTGSQYMIAFQKAGYDPAFSFKSASASIHAADFAVANLEGPLTFADWSPEAERKKWRFRQLPLFAEGIKSAGIDILLLGNNHIADAGDQGIRDTLAVLKEEGLSWVPSPGEGPLVIERGGTTVELWNADVFSRPHSHPWALESQELVSVIAKRYRNTSKPRLVIAFVHGHFAKKEPMDDLALRLRNAGVDWVIFGGEHAPADMMADKSGGGVHYGIGDFIFGCECSGAPRGKALVLKTGSEGAMAQESDLQLGQQTNGYITTFTRQTDINPSSK
ncbi:MAG: CapA family protein [Nitrospirota bacterium]